MLYTLSPANTEDCGPEQAWSLGASRVLSSADLAALQRDLIGTISHELRTPLTSIKGFLEVLLRARVALDDQQQLEILRMMRENVEEMHVLVVNAVLAAQLAAGNVVRAVDEINLTVLVADAIAAFSENLERRQIRLDVDVPEMLGPVRGDAVLLGVMLRHVISNAIKYSSRGGSLRVTGRNLGTLTLLSVRDEGMGIPSESLAHIFEPFCRQETPDKYGIPGGGLGLFVVKKILEQHYGNIDIRSEPGRGTTVTMVLPEGGSGRGDQRQDPCSG